MAYQALYRAYRPQSFVSVAGQKHIVSTLQNAIKLNKVAHAYLFAGPRGTGKTTMAKIMAKALNCQKGPTIEPCNECEICKGITKGTISDVIEIDAASNNGVEEIRELRDKVKYLPSECKYKVYIIDEVHMLSQGAFNALLKTLEEPPSHVVFILATTEPHKIPATILSRCQRFDFQSISKEDIIDRLKVVANEEKLNVTDEAFDLISDTCEGGMRDALSLLDQSVSYSKDDLIDVSDVLAVSGNVSQENLFDLLRFCYAAKGADALELLNTILKAGKEIPRVINDLMAFLRDTLLFKVNYLHSLKSIYKTKEYEDFARKIPDTLIYHYLDVLNETLNNIKFTNQKRAYLELSILKMANNTLNDFASLVERVSRLEQLYDEKFLRRVEEDMEYKTNFTTDPQDLPSFEELQKEEVHIQTDDSYINIKDVEEILNSANKQIKAKLQQNLEMLLTLNPNDFVTNIIVQGKIGAASDNSCILVLKDIAKCNRIMRGEFYNKTLELLNQNNDLINSLLCIPEESWNTILKDFATKYKQGILKPELNYVQILVKKHQDVVERDEDLEKLEALFDKSVITIKEDK